MPKVLGARPQGIVAAHTEVQRPGRIMAQLAIRIVLRRTMASRPRCARLRKGKGNIELGILGRDQGSDQPQEPQSNMSALFLFGLGMCGCLRVHEEGRRNCQMLWQGDNSFFGGVSSRGEGIE